MGKQQTRIRALRLPLTVLVGLLSLAVGCNEPSPSGTAEDERLISELRDAVAHTPEPPWAAAHAREVQQGKQAIVLAQLVVARRRAIGTVRVVFDSEIRFLWKESCTRYLRLNQSRIDSYASVPDEVKDSRLDIIDKLPDNILRLDCKLAWVSDRSHSMLVYQDGQWKPANW